MAPSSVLLPQGQRILFVLAHPDDAEFLCGGTVALLAAEGKDLHYLLVTRGDKGSDDPEMPRKSWLPFVNRSKGRQHRHLGFRL